jgi:hypothetical protein
MFRLIASAGLVLATMNGCALDSGVASTQGEDVGSVQQNIGNNSRHFVNATLQSGFAHCPNNEMLVGVDPASRTRIVCDTLSGTVFDGGSTDTTHNRASGTATCNSTYAVAVAWNHDTGAIKCRLITPGPLTDWYPDGAATTQYSQLSANSHQTTTFSWWNGTFTDEMTVCAAYRGIRDISLKTLTGGGLTFFYTCGA